MLELIDIAADLGVDPDDYATWTDLAAYAADRAPKPEKRKARAPRKREVSAPAVRTEQLSKTYGSTKALVSLDLEVPKGEVLGYLGPNGAGKTTTIKLLLALIKPTSGRAEIFGLDAHASAVDAHKRVAYVPGEVNLWPSLTGSETLHL